MNNNNIIVDQSTIKTNEVLTHITMFVHLKNIILREKKPDTESHIMQSHLHKMSRIGKSIKTKSRLIVSRDWRKGERGISWVGRLGFRVMEMF